MPARPLIRIAALASATASLLAAAPALADDALPCPDQTVAKVFAPWNDQSDYTLAPDGAFESGPTQWTLSGEAAVVDGNEPFAVNDAADSHSLALPAGSVATSPRLCTDEKRPSLRFFVRRTGGSPWARLRVDVRLQNAWGRDVWVPTGMTVGSGAWAPSPQMAIVGSMLPPRVATPVQLRFVAHRGDFQVDDLYLDPYSGH